MFRHGTMMEVDKTEALLRHADATNASQRVSLLSSAAIPTLDILSSFLFPLIFLALHSTWS